MTVKRLMEILATYPADAEVRVVGFDFSHDPVWQSAEYVEHGPDNVVYIQEAGGTTI